MDNESLQILNDAFNNLTVLDVILPHEIKRITINGHPEQIQTVETYVQLNQGDSVFFYKIVPSEYENKIVLHIFAQYYVLELYPNDETKRVFLVITPSPHKIESNEEMAYINTIYKPLIGLSIVLLINLIQEQKKTNNYKKYHEIRHDAFMKLTITMIN